MFAPRRRSVIALIVFACLLGAGDGRVQDEGDANWDVTADLNGDGVPDRASMVAAPDGETSDLHIFLGSSAKPDIVKKAIISGMMLSFESREKASLTLRS